MEKNYTIEKASAYANVLTTEETCSILNRSRQQLNNLMKQGKIKPFKSTSNGNLFWRPEVYSLLREINREVPRKYHKILGYSTHECLEKFRELKIRPENVVQVYVFFDSRDAAQYNFYNLLAEEMPNTLTEIEAARLIIVTRDDEEYWFNGFTCGYNGTGCHGTYDLLTELKILPKEKELSPIIRTNYALNFYRDPNNVWQYESIERSEAEVDYEFYKKNHLDGLDLSIYRYNGHLVLLQNAQYNTGYGSLIEPTAEILFKSLHFTPNPVSVEFFSREEALQSGHYKVCGSRQCIYQIIIRDISDRELWLNYPFEQMPDERSQSMRDLFRKIGFSEIPNETKPKKLAHFLGLKPKVVTKTKKIYYK